eukprot:CAMPEP_0115159860 /NCGR_PEP_ID=MMETSP0227-20121206/70486_1 /TAXON_ID=89957 /ORGANISM="Polarella glacialis, Strain CCMP 1383" /LENGTH=310 /DNA_ID=CAMNT_0002571697 /DNA_START=111 /DNA_END=1043 /DNA_ORIENTATION=-
MASSKGVHPNYEGRANEDQMSLGIRIITTAFQNKMNSLEQEIRGLRITLEEQRTNVGTLQRKNSGMEVELVESHQRSQQLAEENKELFKTVGSLRKQIGRLEHLKEAVMSSIQDDQVQEAELGDTKVLMSDEYLRGQTPLTAAEMGYGPPARSARPPSPPPMSEAKPYREAPQASYREASLPPYEPTTMPTGPGAAGAYRGPPQGATYGAPAAYGDPGGQYGGPCAPSAASTHGAPGGASSPVVDGKQFFRQARNRLSYEAFNLFLASIKRLNNQQQTREDTLDEARRIFGPELQDLYKDFEGLLNRHGM